MGWKFKLSIKLLSVSHLIAIGFAQAQTGMVGYQNLNDEIMLLGQVLEKSGQVKGGKNGIRNSNLGIKSEKRLKLSR